MSKGGREGRDVLAVFITCSYSSHSDCDGLQQSVAKRPGEGGQEEKEGKATCHCWTPNSVPIQVFSLRGTCNCVTIYHLAHVIA